MVSLVCYEVQVSVNSGGYERSAPCTRFFSEGTSDAFDLS